MSKLKVLMFHPALAPYRIDQFNAMGELFDLEVVFIFDNVRDHKFDQQKLRSQLHFKHSYLLNGPAGSKGRAIRYGMLKTIRRTNPDIIFGYEFSFTTQYLLLLKGLGVIKQKIGSTIDDSIDICHHVQTKMRYYARKYSVKRLDYLVVLSREVAQFYQTSFNLKGNQLIVSPILQAPERLRADRAKLETIAGGYTKQYDLTGKKVLLFVGRFIAEKGLAGFIEHVYPILLAHADLVLVLVGEGQQKETIKNLVENHALQNKVIMPGRFEGEELNAWYLCASGFVLPSTFEPFGAVVNEALIFGLNVFCSQYAGASYLVTQKNGLLFDPLSEESTLQGLRKFIDLLPTVKTIDLQEKPSLMASFKEELISEWGKLSYT
ncbi:glycosyltransferase [Dyadobacter sp. CY345]|uniref:glycosyltransferase n=1 Tax=Dyadobacter sp. CY345 TaxID=2909335 RepID=UPI001F3916BC|nr:glycosyltransferase [Dyadobacter sp. CY345]MCF2447068.1 glycosyltransferase [Dyadobacter sp. CY345]